MPKKDAPLPRNLRNPETERIKRWRWLLNQDIPIIGGWMHEHVLLSMTESALSGNALAVQSIAMALVHHKDPDVRKLAEATIRKVNFTSGIDAAWGVWVDTRNPILERLLVEKRQIASNPASARLLSALCLEDMDTVTRGSADLIPALISACHDMNSQIAERAVRGIRSLKNSASIDAICRIWFENRNPFLAEIIQEMGYVANKPARTRVYSALKIDKAEILMQASPEMVPAMVEACTDSDHEISSRANNTLLNLQKQSSVDAFCQLWSETRNPLLEQIMVKAGYKAHTPLKVQLLVALRTGQEKTAASTTPDGLPYLMDAINDPNPIIKAAARKALETLILEETQEALALKFIDSDDHLAREISVSRGYAPREAGLRALFFFLTEQWDRYDDLDYDQSLMRTVYEGAGYHLRQRITSLVQKVGRTSYLTILAGLDFRSRAVQVNPNESTLLIRVLAQNHEWNRLWALVTELALPFSIQIVQTLNKAGWHPENALDQKAYSELSEASNLSMVLSGTELTRVLPQALLRSQLKIHGRVNDVAFSPISPVIAIASSSRKVVLWNFQTATIEKVLKGFKHSVGKLTFMPDGTLLCGERANSASECIIAVYQNDQTYHLHNHNGSITVLEPVGQDRILTAGRDSKVTLWDVKNRKLVKEIRIPDGWARNASVAPDLQSFALLEDRLQIYRLPDMRPIPGQPFIGPRARTPTYKKGKAHTIVHSPDGKYILTGQYNGQVALYFHTSLTQRPTRSVITTFEKPIRGIHFLPYHPVVVIAGAEGVLTFLQWPELNSRGTIQLENKQERLTSMHISKNGNFMATGSNDSSLHLWDLRLLDVPDLFAQPLANATHEQVETIIALSNYDSLPKPILNGLKFMRLLLQYRFRHDIQIEEAQSIQFGEFDIFLEDEKE